MSADDDKPPKRVSQTHYGSGHNINAGTVHIGQPRFQLTDDILARILANAPSGSPVRLQSYGSMRSSGVADRIIMFLQQNGRTVVSHGHTSMGINIRTPDSPIEVSNLRGLTVISVDVDA